MTLLLSRSLAVSISFLIIFFISANYIAAQDSSIVERYGQLKVEGNRIVDKNSNPVALHGMSLFWSQWGEGSKYYNYDCIKWLRDDWKCTVVRAAMGVELGGYLTNPTLEKNRVKTVVEACTDLGIYVIIDWHDHNAQNHRDESIAFFREMAGLYGDYPNVIYEIFNEPLQVSWPNVIKPYSDSVVSNIRSIDPDNLIIVGTPTWSQDVELAANSPLDYDNIAYALHYYAATHKQFLRGKATTALNRGAALFVSEYGTCESTGSGTLDSNETRTWWNFLDQNKISWCNWSVADKVETASAVKPGASAAGGWALSDLTHSGILVRDKLRSYNDSTATGVALENLPDKFELQQNYPNPFNPETSLQYAIGSRQLVNLKIYDLLGSEVATLVNEEKEPGVYNIEFDGTGLSSGIYFYKLTAGDFVSVKKMILQK